MPQRATPRCYHPRIAPFIWPIADGVSHCITSAPTQCRRFGHLPGPLEAQRRLGKRRMTDIQPSTPSALPPVFAISVYAPRAELKWSPPSSLVMPGPPPPPPPAPGPITRWIDEFLQEDEEPVDLTPKQPSAEALLLRRADDVANLLESQAAAARWEQEFTDLCLSLECNLCTGQISPSVADRVFTRVAKGLRTYYSCSTTRSDVDSPWLGLCSSLVKGAAACTVQGLECFSPKLWSAILYRLSTLTPSTSIADLFVLLMRSLPPDLTPRLAGGAKAVLTELLQIRQVSLRREIPAPLGHVDYWAGKTRQVMLDLNTQLFRYSQSIPQRRLCAVYATEAVYAYTHRFLAPFYYTDHSIVGSIASALKNTPHWPDLSMISGITQSICSETGLDTPYDRHTRYQWALLLARLPHVKNNIFFPVMAALFRRRRGTGSITPTELAELLISHWISNGKLDNPNWVRAKFELGYRQPILALLCRVIFETQRHLRARRRYEDLYRLLRTLGIKWILVKSFLHVDGKRFLPTLRSLIPAIKNELFSAQMRAILVTMGNTKLAALIWDAKLGGKTMNDHLMENLNPVLASLRVPHTKRRGGRGRVIRIKGRGRLRAAKILALEHAMVVLGDSPYEMNRRAFRASWRCMRYLRAYKHTPSPHALGSLYKLATASLKEGMPGRPSRVAYVCRLVRKYHGKAPAELLAQGFLRARQQQAEGRSQMIKHLRDLKKAEKYP